MLRGSLTHVITLSLTMYHVQIRWEIRALGFSRFPVVRYHPKLAPFAGVANSPPRVVVAVGSMLNGRRLGSKQKQKAARALVRSGKATAWNASDMPAFPRVHQTARRLAQLLALSASPMGVLRSEADLQRAAARVATASHELVLTTVGMDAAQTQLLFLRQWAGNLRHRAANVLLIGTDEATCHVARNASIPCFVDAMVGRAAVAARPKRAKAMDRDETTKWFYVRALLRLNFHIVFSDADVAWLQDPFRNWDRSFDLQGLSDIYSTNLTVGSHHKVACLDKARERI